MKSLLLHRGGNFNIYLIILNISPNHRYFFFDQLCQEKSAFHRPQTLEYKNGYALPRRPSEGIGQDSLLSDQLTQQEYSDLVFETTNITYSSRDRGLKEVFIPAYVALDKKVKCSLVQLST